MDSTKEFKRTRIPFETPRTISKKAREILLNDYGNVRAVLDGGVVTIQTKKHSGEQREVVRINTNVSPPTIELALENKKA